jgi:tetratricopeptide (TPR) repeat protein
MARLTRRDLKQDKFQTAFEDYEAYLKAHYREIVMVAGIALALAGAVLGVRAYTERMDGAANAQLGAALDTFRAYVGTVPPGALGPGAQSFPTAKEKYAKALEEFSAMTQTTGFQRLVPEPKAVRIARYHLALCQAQLGEDTAAIRTLEKTGRDRDPAIASLARLALAAELEKTEKLPDAAKIYQDLAEHPTSTVPRTTALLALAEAYRPSQPAQARQVYDRLRKEYGSDPLVADVLKEEMAGLAQ